VKGANHCLHRVGRDPNAFVGIMQFIWHIFTFLRMLLGAHFRYADSNTQQKVRRVPRIWVLNTLILVLRCFKTMFSKYWSQSWF